MHREAETRTAAETRNANPVLVEATRGKEVESRHRGAYAVVDSEGKLVLSGGAIDLGVFPRSAIKPLQALALVETGAAEAYGLNDAEIALACASHSGERRHSDSVRSWLERLGLDEDDLECGAHLPFDDEATAALVRAGREPDRTHNNCSGKHSGFLTVAKHLGHPTKRYIDYGHPVQQRVIGIMEQMTGLDLADAPWGIDGCGIPTIAIPLGNLALAMARLADPRDQPETRQRAAGIVLRAMAAEPFMVAGSGRFCTVVMQAAGARAAIKTGAEGVYCASLPELGLGVALKIDDGAGRAAEVAMGALLRRLEVIDDDLARTLADRLSPPIVNRAGERVGELRVAAESGIL